MLILLPPSETKRDGGDGSSLMQLLADHHLSFPELDPTRKRVAKALASLAKRPEECIAALKLSPKQTVEVQRNKVVLSSPTMPAIDRYTGVLYDGLASLNLSVEAREFLAKHVLIQSALMGVVAAMDPIPAYRLSFDSHLPATAGTLKQTWAPTAGKVLNRRICEESPLVLDLRSEGYCSLAPLVPSDKIFYLRVVTKGDNGQVKALNHFNKKGKGEFVRALARDYQLTENISSVEELISWAKTRGILLELGKPSSENWPAELNLVVSGTLAKLC